MPNVFSSLQFLCRWITAAAVVLLFVIVTASGTFGGRQNMLTAYAETSSETSVIEEAVSGEDAAEASMAGSPAAVGLSAGNPGMEGLEEKTQVTQAKIQLRFTDPQSLQQGKTLAGDTLVKDVQMRREVWEERKEAIEQAKNEIRQIEEKREETTAKRNSGTEAGTSADRQEVEAMSAPVRCSEQDYELLKRIVQAEAGICDTRGRILVANVIMNRVRSEEFPDTIREVVYQKSQFSPVTDGRLYTCEVTQETVDAVDRALAGEDYSHGALYFMNRSRSGSRNVSWFDRNLTYLFQHDNHEFFR